MRMLFLSFACSLSSHLSLSLSLSWLFTLSYIQCCYFLYSPLFEYSSPGCCSCSCRRRRSFSLSLYRTRSFFSLVFVTDINNVTHLHTDQNRCACPNLFPLNRVRCCFSFSSSKSYPYSHSYFIPLFLLFYTRIWFARADICLLRKSHFQILNKTTKLFKK